MGPFPPILSAEEFVRLQTSEVMEEYNRAAWAEVPEAVCLEVIARYPEMREWVAHNKQAPLGILAVLARDPDDRVRWTVATRRKLTPELLELLSRDGDATIRARIARHPKVTVEIVERLAADEDPWVREQVAELRRTR